MTAAWMTGKARLAEKLRGKRYGWARMPSMGQGDAGMIAATAGISDDEKITGLVIAVDQAIAEVDLYDPEDIRDPEEYRWARAARRYAIEEFLIEVRCRMLPELVAAEEEEDRREEAEAEAESQRLTGEHWQRKADRIAAELERDPGLTDEQLAGLLGLHWSDRSNVRFTAVLRETLGMTPAERWERMGNGRWREARR
jgi:hypothetical protein